VTEAFGLVLEVTEKQTPGAVTLPDVIAIMMASLSSKIQQNAQETAVIAIRAKQ